MRARCGQGVQAVRRQGRVRNPRPRVVRCAARPIGGGDDLPNQPAAVRAGRTTSTASAKPKHLRVIYANNLTVETRQYASTVMLHDNLYLPREYSCTTALFLLALSLEWLISRLREAI